MESGERDGRKVDRGCGHAGGEGNAVRGAASYPGDVVVFERAEELRLALADGGVVALLSVLIVTPRVHLVGCDGCVWGGVGDKTVMES